MMTENDLSAFTEKNLHKKFKLAWKKLTKKYKPLPQSDKKAFVLGGQPGSGKSSSAKIISKDFLDNNCIFVSGDDFRKYHPKYREINKLFHSQMHEYTSAFASGMVQLMIDKAADNNYNMVVEGTFRTTKAPLSTLEKLKQSGYKTGVAIVACSKELSWQSTITRYEKDRDKGGDGGVVSKEAHDYVVSVLADNANSIYEQKAHDFFTVYKRDDKGTTLAYDSSKGNKFDKSIIENEVNGKVQTNIIFEAMKKMKEKKSIDTKKGKGGFKR